MDLDDDHERPTGISLSDPVYLPEFANDEVRTINDQVIQAEQMLRHIEEAIEDQDERANTMEEHMHRLEQEILQTQCQSDAKRRELATEQHLKKLSEMEVARLQRELLRVQKEMDDTCSTMLSLNASMFKAKEKMEKFRLQMQWNKEELEQWTKAAEQKDEDNYALQMYTKTDNIKIKDLYLEAEKLSNEVCQIQKMLESEITSTQSAQIELDKTAEVFKALHSERKGLLHLWEDAVSTIHKRDENIHKTAEEFAKNKTRLREQKHQLDALAEKLAKEVQMGNELEKKITSKEDEAEKAMDLFQKESASTKESEEELLLMKRNFDLATIQLTSSIESKYRAEEDLGKKKNRLDEISKKLQHTRNKVEEEYILLDTLDKKQQHLENILNDEESNLKTVIKELSIVKEKHFEASEKLGSTCDKEKDTVFEIKGANTQSIALTHQINSLEDQILKLDEHIYSAEFQIQCLERKVSRASGERSDLEAKELKEKLTELEKELEEKKSEEVLVISQIKKAEEDGRAAKRKNEELQKKLAEYLEKTSELTLASETGLNTVKSMVKDKEEKMLARDLLQMEVKKLQSILNLKTDAVFGMEDMRKRLTMNMEERREEIDSKLKKNQRELKSLQQELHGLGLKKKRLYICCEKLQAKYEAVLRRTKAEDGQSRSPQHFLAKASKEKKQVEEEGYQIENQINQVQKEIAALEVAIDDVKEVNELLRHSHKPQKMKAMVDEEDHMRSELEHAVAQLKDRHRYEQGLIDELSRLQSAVEHLQLENNSVMDGLRILHQQIELANKDVEEQSQKYKRAKAQLAKLVKEIKSSNPDEADKVMKEMQLVELSLTAEESLYKLRTLASDFPEYASRIEERISKSGFPIPHTVSTVRSTRSSVSSLSSRGSTRSFPTAKKMSNPSTARVQSIPGSARSSRSGSAIVTLEFGGSAAPANPGGSPAPP